MVNPVRGDGWFMMDRSAGGRGEQAFRRPRGPVVQVATQLSVEVFKGFTKFLRNAGLTDDAPNVASPRTVYQVEVVTVDDAVETFTLEEVTRFLTNRPRSDILAVRKLLNERIETLLLEAPAVDQLAPHVASRQCGLWTRVSDLLQTRVPYSLEDFPALRGVEERRELLQEVRDRFRSDVDSDVEFFKKQLGRLMKDLRNSVIYYAKETEQLSQNFREYAEDLTAKISELKEYQEETNSAYLKQRIITLEREHTHMRDLRQRLDWYNNFLRLRAIARDPMKDLTMRERLDERSRAQEGLQLMLTELQTGHWDYFVRDKHVDKMINRIRRGIGRVLQANDEENGRSSIER